MYKRIAGSALCAAGLLAQSTVNSKDAAEQKALTLRIGDVAEFGAAGITTAMGGPMVTVRGAPYSAQALTERVQVLGDGNRIVQNTSGSVARDSQGRVRRDEALPGFASGKGDAPHMIFIEDPVAGVHWNLDARTKTAFKMHMPQIKSIAEAGARSMAANPPMPPPGSGDKMFFVSSDVMPRANVQIFNKLQTLSDGQVSKSDLGTQMIEGVKAQGTKVTRTIPAGEVGNEQPVVITTETWYSPQLKVLVSSKTSDPRMGETTYRLSELQRSEPANELFEVPSDYTVRDSPLPTFTYQDTKKVR